MATSYQLQQRLLPGGAWDNVVGTISPNSDGELRQTVGSLVTGNSYEFRFVRNASGALAFSNAVSATTAAPTTLSDGGTMAALGQYTIGDGSITRTTSGVFVNFSAANWQWVGADISASEKYFASRVNSTPNPLGVWTTNVTKVVKRSNRLVEILLPQSVGFVLKISGDTKSYTVTSL
jgi:hypothetical protein